MSKSEIRSDHRSVPPFIVRVIYFTPLNVPLARYSHICALLKQVQEKYATEMERHGYGLKTFKLEKNNNNILIHNIKGHYNADHYISNTYEKNKT